MDKISFNGWCQYIDECVRVQAVHAITSVGAFHKDGDLLIACLKFASANGMPVFFESEAVIGLNN